MKMIDLSKSVHEICSEYPEVAEIMKEIGFKEIANPGMINTAGRFMTIPKGAAIRRINMDQIKETFAEKGFEISE
ncbi:DUF1858 domain-containing protein [Desulfitobacterium sp. THU1]|uniref:DUF1858 domain-containing protein n=1 Tax=Desulfitobacterium sp. THU1 TaxID=3138072 RepID=UPI00311F15BA